MNEAITITKAGRISTQTIAEIQAVLIKQFGYPLNLTYKFYDKPEFTILVFKQG